MVSGGQRLAILVSAEATACGEHGILFAPARGIDADTVNAMARHGRGLIACCLRAHRAWELGLTTMTGTSWRRGRPRFLTSVEAAACEGTGISAADRALTLSVLGDPASTCADVRSPGHVMPCIASTSDAQLSAAALEMVDGDAVAWCTILDDDGELASHAHCIELGHRLGIEIWDVEDGVRRHAAQGGRRAFDWRDPDTWQAGVVAPMMLRGDLTLSGWL